MLQSSANISGQPDARTLEEVPRQLREGADLVIDGGELPGTPSTVIDLRELHGAGTLARAARGRASALEEVESGSARPAERVARAAC